MQITHQHRTRRSTAQGFTLLEVILAISILAILTGLIVVITRTAITISVSLVEDQVRQEHSHAFEDYVDRTFENYTNESRTTLEINDEQTGTQIFTLDDINMRFPSQGKDIHAKRCEFITSANAAGIFRLELHNYATSDEQITEQTEPTSSLILIDNLRFLTWEIYKKSNKDNEKWDSEWQRGQGRPSQIRLTYQRADDFAETSHLIWLPAN